MQLKFFFKILMQLKFSSPEMSRPHFGMAGGKLVDSSGKETAVDVGEHTLGRGPLLKVVASFKRLAEKLISVFARSDH